MPVSKPGGRGYTNRQEYPSGTVGNNAREPQGSGRNAAPHARAFGVTFRYVLWVSLVSFLVGSISLLILVYTFTLTPQIVDLKKIGPSSVDLATIVYTADGQEIARYYKENRTWDDFDQIAPGVTAALIATEDHRFYQHPGIDPIRLVSSLYKTIKGNQQGGSTLTMQLARNLDPKIGFADTFERKLKEIITAVKIERRYTKKQILEMYLNTVPFGSNAYGIEAAAQTYFNKPASRLDTLEAATLVGMLKGNTRYNPVLNPDLSLRRRNIVLAQMKKYGYLSRRSYRRMKRLPLSLEYTPQRKLSSPAPHFAEYVRVWLEDWAARSGYDIYSDGLRVYTTIDSELQALARESMDRQMAGLQAVVDYEWSQTAGFNLGNDPAPYQKVMASGQTSPFSYFWATNRKLVDGYIKTSTPYRQLLDAGFTSLEAVNQLRQDPVYLDSLKTCKTRLEAGLVAMDPNTGFVLAWVGGRDFEKDQYDKVGMARRQPGSTFKPFVYAAAIDYGLSPDSRLTDSLATIRIAGSREVWRPRNSEGWYTGGKVTLRDGLALSKNNITVQLVDRIGASQVVNYARRLGISSPLDAVPSIALGTSEVSLFEMVEAYSSLATGGLHREPVFVTSIRDAKGKTIQAFASEPEKAVSMYTAYAVVDMLRTAVDKGTGSAIRSKYHITGDVAGKTGTTQSNADGWFILMHPRLVTGAWVGFNDRRITFRSNYWGQGGHNALHLVGDFYNLVSHLTRFVGTTDTFVRPPTPIDDSTAVEVSSIEDPTVPSDTTTLLNRRDADVERTLRDGTQ